MVFSIFWGSPQEIGSLCNLREYIKRLRVDKTVKVFSIGDEFLVHTFKSHLRAAICSIFKVKLPEESIPHEANLQWLQGMAEKILPSTLYPVSATDPVYNRHRAFLHLAYLYIDLRSAIQHENGQHIIRHWKWWLPRFIGLGLKNYSTEAANLIANVTARFPKHIAYIAIHNRTVNVDSRPGHGKPMDQLLEHYNL